MSIPGHFSQRTSTWSNNHNEKQSYKLASDSSNYLGKSNHQLPKTTNNFSAKALVKVGLATATTALIYGLMKTFRFFPQWLNGQCHQQDVAQKDRKAASHRQETGLYTGQKTIDRLDRDLPSWKQNHNTFEELKISNIDILNDVPKDESNGENDSLEIGEQTAQYQQLLQILTGNPNSIPDQIVLPGHLFEQVLDPSTIFREPREGFLSLSSVHVTGQQNLPSWLAYKTTFSHGFTGSVNLEGTYGIATVGNTAFVCGFSGLQMINISQPIAPTTIGSINIPHGDGCRYVTAENSTVFVASSDSLYIIDVFNVSAPIIDGSIDVPSNPAAMTVVNNTVFAAFNELDENPTLSSLHIIDVSNRSTPTTIGLVNVPEVLAWGIQDVAVVNNTAFVVTQRGLTIINVSNPFDPVIVKWFDMHLTSDFGAIYARAIDVVNNAAFVTDSLGGLHIIDVSSLAVPVIIGSLQLNNACGFGGDDITVIGNTAFVLSSDLCIIDVSNLHAPTFSKRVRSSGRELAVKGNTALITGFGFDRLYTVSLISKGRLSGTAPLLAHDLYSFDVTAQDSFGGLATDTFLLAVNYPPVLQNSIPSQIANFDQLFYYAVPSHTFTDPDSDHLHYLITAPSWLNVSEPGQIIGIPARSDAGVYRINVSADDGFFLGRVNTSFIVVVGQLSPQIATVNQPFNFTVPSDIFANPDNNPIQYCENCATLSDDAPLPSWLSFDTSTATFTGTPGRDDAEELFVKLTASDGLGWTESAFFNLKVNTPPIANVSGSEHFVTIGSCLNYIVPREIFTDRDQDFLSYNATLANGEPLPSWMRFDSNSRTLSGTPTMEDAGSLEILITASDSFEGKASAHLSLFVNQPPQIDPHLEFSVPIAQTFAVPLPEGLFIDNDHQNLTFSLTRSDGKPLQGTINSFLHLDSETRTLYGAFYRGSEDYVNNLNMTLTADDQHGGRISVPFKLNFVSTHQSSESSAASISNWKLVMNTVLPLICAAGRALPRK